MIQTINSNDFVQAFRTYGRQDQFSREALEMLFDYFEDIDPNMELDVIAVCCDYAESDPLTIAQDYGIDLGDTESDDTEAIFNIVMDYLQDNTSVVGTTKHGIVYCSTF